MQLGWIDYSQNDRKKVYRVLESFNNEKDILDELGISPVRDGFSDVFFPGTTTIQTKAKYFLIVPYIFRDIERNEKVVDKEKVLEELGKTEKECAELLTHWSNGDSEKEIGIIGGSSLGQAGWVKRRPSDIYWSGLRRYRIFQGNKNDHGNMSIPEYIRAMCLIKNEKSNTIKQGNRKDDISENGDDKNAGDELRFNFWSVWPYGSNWKEGLESTGTRLTKDEAAFLKERITDSCPDTMISYLLKGASHELRQGFLNCDSFLELKKVIEQFPDNIKKDYQSAYDFSRFFFVLQTVYNMLASDSRNEEAEKNWKDLTDGAGSNSKISEISEIDLEYIKKRLELFNRSKMNAFLEESKQAMKDADLEGLKRLVKQREFDKKKGRARTSHLEMNAPEKWYGVKYLDYRFRQAKGIIKDILIGEGEIVEQHTESQE